MDSLIGGIRDAFRAGFRSVPQASVPTPYTAANAGIWSQFSGRGPAAQRGELAAMGGNGTLFAIVGQLAGGTSRVSWHLYRKRIDGRRRFGPATEDRTEVLVHQALTLMNRPNPFMPWQEFAETFCQHVRLVGEGWWVVERTELGNIPVAMWPVRPDRMAPVPDPDDFVSGYVYRSPDGELVPLDVEDVVFIRVPNPEDIYRGMGAVQTVLTDVYSAAYAAEWNMNFFLNSAQPGGIIEVEKALSDTQFKQMLARWRESHQGVSNAHRVAVLEHGKWRDRQFSMRDMQFKEMREISGEIIREAFAYPKFLLGIPEGSNRASAMAAEYVEARRLLVPDLERIKAALNFDFLPMFGPAGEGLEFDYDSPVPADDESAAKINEVRARTAQVLLGIPGVKFDAAEVLEAVGLPPLDFEEVEAPALPAGPVPLPEPGDDEGEEPGEPDAPAKPKPVPDDEDDIAALLGDLGKRITNGHSFGRHAGGRR